MENRRRQAPSAAFSEAHATSRIARMIDFSGEKVTR
jgi:hypothetical protein